MSFEAVLGWFAAALSAMLTVPQLVRILRTRSVAGLNLLTWQTILIAGIGWTSHGLIVERAQLIIPNSILLVGAAAVLWQLQRSRHLSMVTVWALPIAVSAAAIGLDYAYGPVIFAIMMFIPAVVGQVFQYREIASADDISGVSPAMLLVNAASQVAWLWYALLTWELAVICVASPLLVVMSANVVVLLNRRRYLARRATSLVTAAA